MEQNNLPQNESSIENNSISAKHNTRSEKLKMVAYPLIAVAIGVLVFFVIVRLKNSARPSNGVSGIVQEKDTNLPEDQKNELEASVKALQGQISELQDSAGTAQRYKLYRQLAGAQYRLGKYSDAIKSLDTIAGENQNNSAMWALYTLVYADMGDLAKAHEVARKAVDNDKTNPNHWLAYIELSSVQGESQLSMDDLYQEALASADPSTDVVVDYAGFLEKSGNKKRAIEQWQRAGQLNPAAKATYDANIARLMNS